MSFQSHNTEKNTDKNLESLKDRLKKEAINLQVKFGDRNFTILSKLSMVFKEEILNHIECKQMTEPCKSLGLKEKYKTPNTSDLSKVNSSNKNSNPTFTQTDLDSMVMAFISEAIKDLPSKSSTLEVRDTKQCEFQNNKAAAPLSNNSQTQRKAPELTGNGSCKLTTTEADSSADFEYPDVCKVGEGKEALYRLKINGTTTLFSRVQYYKHLAKQMEKSKNRKQQKLKDKLDAKNQRLMERNRLVKSDNEKKKEKNDANYNRVLKKAKDLKEEAQKKNHQKVENKNRHLEEAAARKKVQKTKNIWAW